MEYNIPVLIVDDDPLVRRTLSDILRAKGYIPEVTSSGQNALAFVQKHDPVIALIDLRLEDMPGLDVIRQIKEIARHTECIVLTGFATQSSAIEAVNVGAYSYFQKPYDMEQLLITIQRAIERIEMEVQRAATIQALAESEARHQRLLRQQIIINRLAIASGEARDLPFLYSTIYRYVKELLDIDVFIASSYDPFSYLIHATYVVHDQTVLDVSQFPPIPLERSGYGTQSQVIRSGLPLRIDDYVTDVHHVRTQYSIDAAGLTEIDAEDRELVDRGPKSALLVPMLVQGKPRGVLQVQSYRHHAYTDEDQDLLMGLANVAAIAIENARLLEQAHTQAQQVREIIQTVPDGVVVLTPERRVLMINPTAAGMMAVLAAHVTVGEVLTDLASTSLIDLLTPPPDGSWHSLSAGGSHPSHYEVTARSIEGSGQLQGWVLVIRDVTMEREVQTRVQQNERLAAVGQLAAGIAHDFNNIMAIILLYAQMSRKLADIPPVMRERLDIIGQQAEHATELISQILDFSRSSVLKRAPLDLRVFVKAQAKLLDRTLPESIKVEVGFSGRDFMITADPTRIQQVIMNLAVNARDAMPDGGTFSIAISSVEIDDINPATLSVRPGTWIRMDVRDTGTGIMPEVLPHIFDPFFTTKGPGEGTGLGLSQVHGIIKQHDGEIGVTSVMDEGNHFHNASSSATHSTS